MATRPARAQATPAAVLRISPSVFAGATATETGLHSGRNLGATAGLDIALPRGWLMTPALEYRATLAVDKGSVAGLKNQLFGLKLAARVPLVEPYATLLYGRSEIQYVKPLQVPGTPVFYTDSSSNVLAFGGGVDYELHRHFGLKLDVQSERYATPVSPGGHLYAASAMVGLVYHVRLGLFR